MRTCQTVIMEFKLINLDKFQILLALVLLSCLLDSALCQDTVGRVRLVGGDTENEGRVEIYYEDEWGTICDYRFMTHDAYIICHQLGYYEVDVIYGRTYFGEGAGPILWDLNCHGHDSELEWTDCFFLEWNTNGCTHNEDVGLRCSNISSQVTDVRLVDGESEIEGRVEISYRGEWGTICDSSFSLHDGHLICQQLGYLGAAEVYSGVSSFGAGVGPIAWNFNCDGLESELKWTDCYIREWNTNECSHDQDVGLRCSNISHPASNVRLVDGQTEYEGRVEVFYYGQWGTICDSIGFDTSEGDVICHQLGFSRAEQVLLYSDFGEGEGAILKELNCNGDEIRWNNCSFDDWGTTWCSHSTDVGLRCFNRTSQNNVRISNKYSTHGGRLQIYYNNEWGTVCGDNFTLDEGNVICRQLGYVRALDYYTDIFGEGYGPIMRHIDCNGHETNWTECEFKEWGTTTCTHGEDVGLKCTHYPDVIGGNNFPIIWIILAVGFVIFVISGMICWPLCVYTKKRMGRHMRRQEVLAAAAGRQHEGPAGQSMIPTANQKPGLEDNPPSYKDTSDVSNTGI